MYELQREYIRAYKRILDDVDYSRLHESCNSNDSKYAQEILESLHRAFTGIYGNDTVKSVPGDFLQAPAVIRSRNTGEIVLGLVILNNQSIIKHWGTTFLTKEGVMKEEWDGGMDDMKKYIREHFTPYDYWFTPRISGDFHVNYSHLPEQVQVLMAPYKELNQSQESIGNQVSGNNSIATQSM